MVARERDLARAGEVEVVGGQVVDLVGVLAEEPGAAHDLRAHQRRGDQRDEAGRERAVERETHQGELQTCADAAQEVEARAGDLDAARDVDGAEHLAQLDVVARLEVETWPSRRPRAA